MDQMKNPLMLASGALAAASVGTGADAQSMPDGFYAGLSFGDYVGANNDDGYSWNGSTRGGFSSATIGISATSSWAARLP
tara:strand:- start:125 stop:364 length:240 start_codon:yes stop_codon:yes gene_type:complete